MDLRNKGVIVTGGSDGIGKHMCIKLAAAGARVGIIGRDAARLAEVARLCNDAGPNIALPFALDLTDTAALNAMVPKILSDMGETHVLINNAGIWHKTGPLDAIPDDVLVATVQTNLTSLMQLTAKVLPTLRAADEAAIINVASKSGVMAQAGQSVYTATKYGVRGFTDVLKQDEKEHGVRIAGVYQSGTNTQMFAKAGEDVPNHIFTEPEDLADVVTFMLSRPPKIWLHDVRVEL